MRRPVPAPSQPQGKGRRRRIAASAPRAGRIDPEPTIGLTVRPGAGGFAPLGVDTEIEPASRPLHRALPLPGCSPHGAGPDFDGSILRFRNRKSISEIVPRGTARGNHELGGTGRAFGGSAWRHLPRVPAAQSERLSGHPFPSPAVSPDPQKVPGGPCCWT